MNALATKNTCKATPEQSLVLCSLPYKHPARLVRLVPFFTRAEMIIPSEFPVPLASTGVLNALNAKRPNDRQ